MTDHPPKPKPPSFPPLEVPPELEAVYVNLVRIAHLPAELVFEFAHILPGAPSARIQARIIMSPLGAKLLYRALGENLSRYEASFGEITVPGQKSLADFLFHPPPSDEPPQE